jgi:hypothetical protein
MQVYHVSAFLLAGASNYFVFNASLRAWSASVHSFHNIQPDTVGLTVYHIESSHSLGKTTHDGCKNNAGFVDNVPASVLCPSLVVLQANLPTCSETGRLD